MEQKLFNNLPEETLQNLHNKNILPLVTVKKSINKKQKSALQKETEKYNRLVKNLDALKKEYEQLKIADKDKKVKYQSEMAPLISSRDEAILKFVYSLDHWFGQTKLLKKAARRNIVKIVLHELLRISATPATDALRKIYLQHDWDLTTTSQKEGIIEDLRGRGVKLGKKDAGKMTGEDFYETVNIKENKEKLAAQEAEDNKDFDFEFDYMFEEMFEKGTGKQSKQEQVQASSLENFFKKLYKKLARLIHPDLEQDETVRGFKEEVMKELTQVREENNLYQLLALRARVFTALNIEEEEENAEDEAALSAQYKMLNKQLSDELGDLQAEVYSLNNNNRQWGTGSNGLHSYIDLLSEDGIKMSKTQYKKDIKTYNNYSELINQATPEEVSEFVSNAA